MVVHGFSLLELRKLYVDELFDYYKSLIYMLEKRGDVKEGSFDKLNDGDDVVKALRRQFFKAKVKPDGKGNSRRAGV